VVLCCYLLRGKSTGVAPAPFGIARSTLLRLRLPLVSHTLLICFRATSGDNPEASAILHPSFKAVPTLTRLSFEPSLTATLHALLKLPVHRCPRQTPISSKSASTTVLRGC
jgi:hypothetical protein